ncbi:hypothetical protein THIOSC13_1610020 [uncultured Thiomicrorhabdus sp.]
MFKKPNKTGLNIDVLSSEKIPIETPTTIVHYQPVGTHPALSGFLQQ